MEPIGVLVLIDEDMVETATDLRSNGGFGHGVAPVQQEVVVIEDVVPLFGHDIDFEQPTKLTRPIGTPGKTLGKRFLERALSIPAAPGDAGQCTGAGSIRWAGYNYGVAKKQAIEMFKASPTTPQGPQPITVSERRRLPRPVVYSPRHSKPDRSDHA